MPIPPDPPENARMVQPAGMPPPETTLPTESTPEVTADTASVPPALMAAEACVVVAPRSEYVPKPPAVPVSCAAMNTVFSGMEPPERTMPATYEPPTVPATVRM